MKVYHCKQGEGEWKKLRLGIPTASEIDALVTPEGKMRTGQGPQSFLYKKLCEKLLGFANDGGSWATDQGAILESEALPWYSFTHEVKVDRVGFCTTDDGRVGCSPDGLVGEDGGVEVKCFQPENSLRVLLSGELPKEHVIQVQTSLYVTGRKWWEFVSYSRQWPPLVIRVQRDERVIAGIAAALSEFLGAFDAGLAKITKLRAEIETPRGSDSTYAEAKEWGAKT